MEELKDVSARDRFRVMASASYHGGDRELAIMT
jgi:hypothetical protein